MDPIASINVKKDSTFAMLLEAQARGWDIRYMEQHDLALHNAHCTARMRGLRVHDDARHWFDFTGEHEAPLADLDVILMRKDPPFDMEYIYTTYLLEHVEATGVLIVNKPQALRDANEKLFTAWFPQCTPPTLVARNAQRLRAFLNEHDDIILKPLDGMGGASVFRLRRDDPNISVIIETLTGHATRFVMAQCFIPQISAGPRPGDKRILMVNGEPIPYALARIPAQGETRGNLAVGGQGKGEPLNERERWICAQVGPTLRDKGLLFVGLDVIGAYLTEINVTSPTCIRELDALYELNISAVLLDCIEARLVDKATFNS